MKRTHKQMTIAIIFGLIMASCSNIPIPTVPIVTDESVVQAIHTAAAETVIASIPTNTNTPRPTFTDAPSSTPLPSFTPDVAMTQTAMPSETLSPVEYCENIEYWADVNIDFGQEIKEDTVFTKTWAFKNIGTCDIVPGYVLTYYAGDDFGEHKAKVKSKVSPGEVGQVSISMTAPQKPGTYTANYMFVNPNGSFFGPTFLVRIVVPKPTNTPTPEPTATKPTNTPTFTVEPTTEADATP